MQLDRTDFELLTLLRKNARMPNKALAEALSIAPSTALERVRRLRECGAILGFHAEVAPAAAGIGLQAMVSIRLTRHTRKGVDGFREHLLGLREVLALYHVAGSDDFLVHVGVRDSDHLRDFALSAFAERKEVDHIETRLIFEFWRNTDLAVLGQ